MKDMKVKKDLKEEIISRNETIKSDDRDLKRENFEFFGPNIIIYYH